MSEMRIEDRFGERRSIKVEVEKRLSSMGDKLLETRFYVDNVYVSPYSLKYRGIGLYEVNSGFGASSYLTLKETANLLEISEDEILELDSEIIAFRVACRIQEAAKEIDREIDEYEEKGGVTFTL